MKTLVGKTITTVNGEQITFLRRRKSRGFPFFPTCYLYDILLREKTFSIKCSEVDNLINGKMVTFVFD